MSVSIIMPYWKRREQLEASLRILYKFYPDFEVIVVDDGSGDDLDYDVIRLPLKKEPKNPCVPINVGVDAATSEIIVLTGPEMLHRAPILYEMTKELTSEKSYITAAAWCPDTNIWHCHSSINRNKTGLDAGYHFCSMIFRKFFIEIGGFDERYREGVAYDDDDFLMKLHSNGAEFVMRDDLIVDHPQSHTQWPGKHEINKTLFRRKWKSYASEKGLNIPALM